MCSKIKQFIPCRNCPRKDKSGPSDKLGYYYDKVDGFQVIRECSCHKKWREELELARTFELSKVNPDYSFDDYKGYKSISDLNCLRKIAENPDRFIYKKMIYLWGPNGTQKSSMIQCLAKELIIKGYSVQYELMSDLLSYIVQDFNKDEEQQDKKAYLADRCANCDFLIIDEAFDTKKSTIYSSGYQIPYLDNFIRNRFEINKKSIVFVSNKAQNQIAEMPTLKPGEAPRESFGTSLQSLVERNTRESTLTFLDVWTDNVNTIDRKGLFK